MAEQLITLDEFWSLREKYPLLDARSESEFVQSHIPSSHNLPILNDAERKIVGTCYKQEGSEAATIKGFELVGPRFHSILKTAKQLVPKGEVILYCWRGGMRSQILSWLLSMVGIQVYRLKGGYKTYRTHTFDEVRKTRNLIVLGGKTGVAKTVLIKKLAIKGEQVLDLEGLANHRGSAFGAIGQPTQPTVEQFENLMAEELRTLDPAQVLWVENESRRIGKIILPDRLFSQILQSPLIDIQKLREERIAHIAEDYGKLPKDELIAAVLRLKKRLGGLRTQEAIADIQSENHSAWISNLLVYYDKAYELDLERHEKGNIHPLDLSGKTTAAQVGILLKTKDQIHAKFPHPAH